MQALFLPLLMLNRRRSRLTRPSENVHNADAKPTVPTLLSLIRALRAVKTRIILYQPDENDGTQFTQIKLCIRLAQMALSNLKSEK